MSQWHLDILAETRRQLQANHPRQPYGDPLLDAINRASEKYLHYNQSYREIYHYVQDRIGPSWTIESWLYRTHGIPIISMFSPTGKKKMLATRLAWIDHLEKQFRGKA